MRGGTRRGQLSTRVPPRVRGRVRVRARVSVGVSECMRAGASAKESERAVSERVSQ